MTIFRDFAPLYWAAGLPVIPLRERNKMPDITNWSLFGREMPTEDVRLHWLVSYPNGNIGLPFGPASGLCAIDIDTEDQALIDAIVDICGPTPWVRIGKKGMGLIYRWSGQRNFKLRGGEGGMICEFLGLGNQMVMPPSIHPETGKPYVANVNLWEVLDQIHTLPTDIEDQLRETLGSKGFSIGKGGRSAPVDIVPAGERDVQMVRHAGYLARVVLGIDKTTSFSLFAAINHMHTWVSDFTATVAGDDMDPGKGIAKLLEFIIKDLEKGRTLPMGWDADLTEEWLEHPSIKLIAERNMARRWSVPRATSWVIGKVTEKPDDNDWIMNCIESIIMSVAKDEHFTELQFRVLIPVLMKLGGDLGLKKSDLLVAYKNSMKADEQDWEDHETIAREILEDLEKNGTVRFDQGKFWQWSGSCYRELGETDIYVTIASNIKGSALVRRHSDYTSVINVLRRICFGPLSMVGEVGLNFANGFLTSQRELMDHDPKYGATFTLPFNYNPDSATRCNRWLEFLHDTWGHNEDFEDRVKLIQEMFAVTFFKLSSRYQKAFLLYGRASTGKTVMLDILKSLMPPDAIGSLSPELWHDQFAPTNLVGKAVNICGELPEKGMISGNIFKQVVEGGPTRAAHKGVDSFVFHPQCAHWFASNFLPVSRDSSMGFIRRWMILDFDRVVPEKDQIKDLALQIVAEEREAIAAWAMEGLDRLLRQGCFTVPECHIKRIKQMRRINNSVEAFLDSCAQVQRRGEIIGKELYDLYVFNMRDVGRGSPVSYERFLQMLDDLDLRTVERTDPAGVVEAWVIGASKRQQNAV